MVFSKKNVFSTIYISLAIQIITSLYSYNGVYYDIEEKDKILIDILKIEIFVQFVETFFYIWVIHGLRDFSKMTSRRYTDWFITTPIMLVSTIIFLKYQEYKETKNTQTLTFNDFLKQNKQTIYKIVGYNALMLLFGYLGESNIINKELSIGLGFLFFFLSFKIIYEEYAIKSKIGKNLFGVLIVMWSLYGFAAFLDHNSKNISYNILDVFSKNFYGLYIFFKIRELAKIKHNKEIQGEINNVSL